MDLSLQTQGRIGGGAVIVARGELDYSASERFRAHVEQALQSSPGTLHLDLHLVTFVDSSGVGALVAAHKQAEHAGTRLVLENASDIVHRTLRTAGLLDFFRLPPR